MDDNSVELQKTQAQMQAIQGDLSDVFRNMERINDLMGKFRDLTVSEMGELGDFRDLMNDITKKYKEMHPGEVLGKGGFTGVVLALEEQMKPLEEAIDGFTEQLKRLGEESQKDAAESKAMQQKAMENIRKSNALEEVLTDPGRMTKEKKQKFKDLGLKEETAPKLKKEAKEKLKEYDLENQAIKDLLDGMNKKVALRNKDSAALTEGLKKEKERLDVFKKQYGQLEQMSKLAKRRFDEDERRKRGGGGRSFVRSALEIAGDVGIPGVSQAATVAKYAGRGVESAEDAGGGILSKIAGGVAGIGLGAGVVGAGYTALQGYKAYGMGKQMAAPRTAVSAMAGGVANIRGTVTAPELEKLGYGGLENLQAMQQMGRSLGGRALRGKEGKESLLEASKLARATGLERGEFIQQAGGLVSAGASTPKDAMTRLRSIMQEAVKAGMDASKATEFIQTTIGIQEELLRSTGENNADAIAKSLSMLMGSSKREASAFLRGPEMQTARTLDQAVKAASSGNLPPQAQGTIARALGYGAGGKTGTYGDEYYNFVKQSEKGIFGIGETDEKGKKREPKEAAKAQIEQIRKIFTQYTEEAGGEKPAAIRMKQELGVGVNQFEAMRDLLKNVVPGAEPTKEQLAALEDLNKTMKDPIQQLLETNAKSENLLMKAADQHLPEILKVEKTMLKVQENAIKLLSDMLKKMNDLLGNEGGGGETDIMGNPVAQTIVAGTGLYAAKKTYDVIKSRTGKGEPKIPKGEGKLPRGQTPPAQQTPGSQPSKSYLKTGETPKGLSPEAAEAAKKLPKGAGFMKWAGRLGIAVGTVAEAYKLYKIYDDPKMSEQEKTEAAQKSVAKFAGGFGGMVLGGKLGATGGAIVGGPIGALAGGVLGGAAGYFGGEAAVEGAWDMLKGGGDKQPAYAPQNQPMPTGSPMPNQPSAQGTAPRPPETGNLAPRTEEQAQAQPKVAAGDSGGEDDGFMNFLRGITSLGSAVNENASAVKANTMALKQKTAAVQSPRARVG